MSLRLTIYIYYANVYIIQSPEKDKTNMERLTGNTLVRPRSERLDPTSTDANPQSGGDFFEQQFETETSTLELTTLTVAAKERIATILGGHEGDAETTETDPQSTLQRIGHDTITTAESELHVSVESAALLREATGSSEPGSLIKKISVLKVRAVQRRSIRLAHKEASALNRRYDEQTEAEMINRRYDRQVEADRLDQQYNNYRQYWDEHEAYDMHRRYEQEQRAALEVAAKNTEYDSSDYDYDEARLDAEERAEMAREAKAERKERRQERYEEVREKTAQTVEKAKGYAKQFGRAALKFAKRSGSAIIKGAKAIV